MSTGVYFIYKNLMVVEYFSKLIDLGTLMEQALDRHSDRSKPVIRFEFWHTLIGEELRISHGEEKGIFYLISLKQGSKGSNVKIRFSCTEELDFPGRSVTKDKLSYHGMKKPKSFWTEPIDLNPKVYKRLSFVVKAAEIAGEYIMAYWVQCDEYTSEEEFFVLNVI